MHAEIQLAIVLDLHHDVELLHSGQKVQLMMDILVVTYVVQERSEESE